MFARTWARWIGERGGAAAVQSSSYLDHAEPFCKEFLSDLAAGKIGGGLMGGERPQVREVQRIRELLLIYCLSKKLEINFRVSLRAGHWFNSCDSNS